MTFTGTASYDDMRFTLILFLITCITDCFGQLVIVNDSIPNVQHEMYGGIIYSDIIWLDTGIAQDHHVVSYDGKGNKTGEYSMRYNVYYDTLRRWSEPGKVETVEIYSDSGYISMTYSDTTGVLLQRGEYKLPRKFKNLPKIIDTANEIEYYPRNSEYPFYVPAGTWSYYHSNGALESTGTYLPVNVESRKTYYDTLHDTYGCNPPCTVLIYHVVTDVMLRAGTWYFYDESGRIIREELYEGGLLRSTIQY